MKFSLSVLVAAFIAAFRPRQSVREWVRAQRVPMKENRTFRGQYYEFENRAPFLSALIFDFFTDREARELIFLKDSQSMTTSIAIFCMAWMLVNEPGNVIYITNTRDKVNEFGKDRLAPVFDAIPELSTRTVEAMDDKSAGNSKKSNNSTALAWRFPGGVLYLGGGQATSSLVSTPAAWVILDEVSKHPIVNGMSTIHLGRSRLTGDDDSKLFAFSTPEDEVDFQPNLLTGSEEPVIEPGSIQHLEYLTGTMEHCEVKCPHCGTFQELVFEGLRFKHCKNEVEDKDGKRMVWDKVRILTDTYYQCINTECPTGRIDEDMKAGYFAIPGNFRWQARNPNPHPGKRSAAISALYNVTHAARTWGRIALAFIEADENGGAVAMKSFWTDYLGKPFKQQRVSTASQLQVLKLKGHWPSHDRRTDGPNLVLPFTASEMKFVGLVCDVQADKLKWAMWAFAKDGRLHLLDWGDTGELTDVPDLARSRTWTTKPEPEGEPDEYEVGIVFIDTGHKTQQVYQLLCAEMHRPGNNIQWEGVRGMHGEKSVKARLRSWWVEEYPITTPGGLPTGYTARVNCIDSEAWEEELYVERIQNHDPKVMRPAHPWLILPGDVESGENDFVPELCNMKKDYYRDTKGKALKDRRGRTKIGWIKIKNRPNDYGDISKYALVMWHSVVQREAAMEEGE